MTATRIRELLHAVPFKPFKIHLPGGEKIRVPHPDFAHLSPKGKTMIVWVENGEGLRIIDVALVTELAPEPEKRKKRRR